MFCCFAALSRLEEDKDQLRGYVCKYEAELSKNEATVAQLVADLNEVLWPILLPLFVLLLTL